MSLQQVREGVERLGQELQNEHGLKYQWQGDDRVNFNHKAVKGFVEIQDNKLILELKVGMLYVVMVPLIKKQLVEFLDENLS